MTFEDVVKHCAGNAEFMAEYRRLSGHSLLSRSVIENQIDIATGKIDQEVKAFIAFVFDAVWCRLETSPERTKDDG